MGTGRFTAAQLNQKGFCAHWKDGKWDCTKWNYGSQSRYCDEHRVQQAQLGLTRRRAHVAAMAQKRPVEYEKEIRK